jgi:hypothetical protein
MPDLRIFTEILSYYICQLRDSDPAWWANLFMHKQSVDYSRDVMETCIAIRGVAAVITVCKELVPNHNAI